jgi:hypothetical protein
MADGTLETLELLTGCIVVILVSLLVIFVGIIFVGLFILLLPFIIIMDLINIIWRKDGNTNIHLKSK